MGKIDFSVLKQSLIEDACKQYIKDGTSAQLIINKLRSEHKDLFWSWKEVEEYLNRQVSIGKYSYSSADKSYRLIPRVSKVMTVGKNEAVQIIQNTGGRFMTVEFIKGNGSLRVMNCRYKNLGTLGYIHVVETRTGITKNVNSQTLQSVKIGGITYRVK